MPPPSTDADPARPAAAHAARRRLAWPERQSRAPRRTDGRRPTEPAVDLRDVSVYYGAFRAVKDITFDIAAERDHGAHRPVRQRQVARCCGRSTG